MPLSAPFYRFEARVIPNPLRLFCDQGPNSIDLFRPVLAASARLAATMATMRMTPPILQGPSAKEKKYDRQLRLWAASGQQALENAYVLLLHSAGGSYVAGIETLKNLVLPGVGHFTIVDGEKVKEEDLGVNFFLDEDSLGRSRAEETCNFLKELNPEVKGYAIDKVSKGATAGPLTLLTTGQVTCELSAVYAKRFRHLHLDHSHRSGKTREVAENRFQLCLRAFDPSHLHPLRWLLLAFLSATTLRISHRRHTSGSRLHPRSPTVGSMGRIDRVHAQENG